MAKGIPSVWNRRGRHKMAPPPSRDAHVYRDLREPEPKPEPEKPEPKPEPEPKKPEPKKPEPKPKAPKAKKPEPKPKAPKAKKPEPEVDMKNTKAELLSVARAMGLGVDDGNTKKEILAAIESA